MLKLPLSWRRGALAILAISCWGSTIVIAQSTPNTSIPAAIARFVRDSLPPGVSVVAFDRFGMAGDSSRSSALARELGVQHRMRSEVERCVESGRAVPKSSECSLITATTVIVFRTRLLSNTVARVSLVRLYQKATGGVSAEAILLELKPSSDGSWTVSRVLGREAS